jgi:sugar phosphate isomerase/epimerase
MKIEQVAAQLYTLRDFTKTPAHIAATLRKVRAIGYQAVQASGLGPIAEEELVRLCAEEGLTLCATHEGSQRILDEPEAIAERLTKLGCKYTAYPYPGGVDLKSETQVRELAAKLDRAGAVLKAAGQVLTYHNHACEFYRIGGKTVLDWIYDLTDPVNLQGEIDTYWVQNGGADPVAWCRKLKGRLPLLHLKDYAINAELQPTFAEIGHGNLDFKAIVAAAEDAGCEWFIVEQDVCPGDPFDSLKMSFDYIAANLVA